MLYVRKMETHTPADSFLITNSSTHLAPTLLLKLDGRPLFMLLLRDARRSQSEKHLFQRLLQEVPRYKGIPAITPPNCNSRLMHK